MQKLLEQFILASLLESKDHGEEEAHIPDREDDLLVEPDFSVDTADAEQKTDEVSVAGAVAGVTTPLGTGPTHPNKGVKRKPAWMAASSGYGRAKPKKTKLNKLSK
jgi:hypothetical protein